MQVEHTMYNGNHYVNVYIDRSSSNGLLRFGHEISVNFLKRKDGYLSFKSAWHIGVSDISFNSREEEAFEQTFPGLLAEIRNFVEREALEHS